jgi:signal transduction histidine kinase/DNA-binding NarL/FixJ family response regulator
MNSKRPGKTILHRVVFALLFAGFYLLSFQSPLPGQEKGYRFLKNFTYNEYDHSPQNWSMTQAGNGLLYVANQAGVLEYDGVRWRVIYVPNGPARSLDINEDGIVFVGGQDEIGYLKPDKTGELNYVSLLAYVPEKYKEIDIVWDTNALGREVFFRTTKYLFRWDGKKIFVGEDSPQTYLGSFPCEKTLYIQQKEKGLLKVSGDSLVPVPGGEIFAEKKIFMIAPFGKRNLLIGTRSIGFFLYDGQTAVPFPLEAGSVLNDSKFYHGIVLPSGEIALATLNRGVFLLNPDGRLIETFDILYGLQDQNVKHIFPDKQGNIWLCLNNGISRIEYDSPLSLFDKRSGLEGFILSVARHKGRLFVGTSQGLYSFQAPHQFTREPGTYSNYRCLLSVNDSLLIATSDGVYCFRNQKTTQILKGTSRVLYASASRPGQVWCTSFSGVFLLYQKENQWIGEKRFDIQGEVLYSLQEDEKGDLWIGTSVGSIIHIIAPFNPAAQKIETYDKKHGLPDGDIFVTRVSGRLVFATKKGLYKKDDRSERFVPDQLLGDRYAGGNRPVFIAAEDKDRNIWFHSASVNYRAIPVEGKTSVSRYHIDSWPLSRIPINQVNAIYPDPGEKQVWFAGIDGLFRFNYSREKRKGIPFKVLIRRFKANDQVTFLGSSGWTVKNGKDNLYKTRSSGIIGFQFAAPYFASESQTRYRWILEGHDKEWSTWSDNPGKNYFDLPPGRYVFRVRAKNLYGSESQEDVYRFEILAPWYRTWWALLLFATAAGFMMFLLVKFQRAKRIEKENIRLEALVDERTRKISEQNEQLEKQNEQLHKQSLELKDLDQAKSRFFTNISHEFRTPLTLIINPIETMMAQGADKSQKKHFRTILDSAHRLLRLINQLLDLSRYDSGKMPLKTSCQNIVPFVKSIVASFELMAHQSQIQLEFRTSRESIPIFFDGTKMEEVIYNLLNNAFKYTPANGKISVFIRFRPSTPANTGFDIENNPMVFSGYAEISVKDTGKGIAKDQLPHIFERFYQVDGDKERLNTGTGIGLSVVKEIITLHSGTIQALSEPGKGTEFIIQLPLGHDHLKSGEIASTVIAGETIDKKSLPLSLQEWDENEDEVDDIGSDSPGVSAGNVNEQESGLENGKTDKRDIILVVEDNKPVRKQIRATLEPKFKVMEARDGKEGIDIALQNIPDLIVSDIMMPKADGYELCRTLKKDIRTSHIPIVLLTAKASEDSIIRGYQTRADDYITKPFNAAVLISRIDNLIELRRQLQSELKRELMLLPPRVDVTNEDECFLEEFREIIEKNMSDPDFNIDDISDQMKIGRATLYRKIPALTGETPNDFIKSYRLKRAAQLLQENKLTVTQIAGEVGFTPAHFAKIFKEKFHQTPKEYMISEGKSPVLIKK